ncbi:MAG: anthranilate phosphoribosyltransferase [Planctomycetota bacterium]
MSGPTALLEGLADRARGGADLSVDDARSAIDAMMAGEAADDAIAGFLLALAQKGETVDEVAGAALAMRSHMTPIRTSRERVVDTCGTGGGGSKTFNVSTTAAIVAAAAGATVAKHGNRSVTSRTGSADVLAELGVNIEASVAQVEACLDELGLCFCFAPLMHPAMKHVGAIRRRLGVRTVFNVLGPLANPAGARFQLLGVGLPELRPLLAGAMERLGQSLARDPEDEGWRSLVVAGEDGLGDVTVTGASRVSSVDAEGTKEFVWTPEDFGLERSAATALEVESPAHSAAVIRKLLSGAPGAARDIVVLNAAAALIVAGIEGSPRHAAERAADAIDAGAAAELLQRLVDRSHAPA